MRAYPYPFFLLLPVRSFTSLSSLAAQLATVYSLWLALLAACVSCCASFPVAAGLIVPRHD